MDVPAAEPGTLRWWPRLRVIDGLGAALLAAFAAWVWWASRVREADGGPLIALVVMIAVVAVVARWATFFHGTGAPALLVGGLALYVLITGDELPRGLGPDASPEAAGALLAVATGAAAVVVLRARPLLLRLAFGVVTLAFAVLAWRTGSAAATAIVATVVVATLALLALPMRERRWVVVWPGLVAVLLLLGTATYAALPLPDGLVFGGPHPERVARWSAALDATTDAPLYGTGLGAAVADLGVEAGTQGWARHEPLEVAAEVGAVGGVLLLALLWWALAWVARPGGGPGSVIAGVVIAGSIAHACLEPIWHVPAVPLTLAALAGTASLRGGDAAWRLEALWRRIVPVDPVDADAAVDPDDGDAEDAAHGDAEPTARGDAEPGGGDTGSSPRDTPARPPVAGES